ncbi:MAG: hypothetical protein Q8N62_00715 [Candidatus Omnitrophota bacterium]|nr:hypothetical protein [Candidatus Omnitrophota bacterium]
MFAYRFDRETITSIGGEGKINAAVSATVGVKWDGKDRYQLSENFEAPRQVFFKAEELEPQYYPAEISMAAKGWEPGTTATESTATVRQPDTSAMKSSIAITEPDTFIRVPVTEKLVWVDEQNS